MNSKSADVCMPGNRAVLDLAPLAGRGRSRSAAKASGQGLPGAPLTSSFPDAPIAHLRARPTGPANARPVTGSARTRNPITTTGRLDSPMRNCASEACPGRNDRRGIKSAQAPRGASHTPTSLFKQPIQLRTVIASEAKQTISQRRERMDCFVASAPRNDECRHDSTSRGVMRPRRCMNLPPKGGRGECRVPVAPAASCAVCW
jgi:hypothetical protein